MKHDLEKVTKTIYRIHKDEYSSLEIEFREDMKYVKKDKAEIDNYVNIINSSSAYGFIKMSSEEALKLADLIIKNLK